MAITYHEAIIYAAVKSYLATELSATIYEGGLELLEHGAKMPGYLLELPQGSDSEDGGSDYEVPTLTFVLRYIETEWDILTGYTDTSNGLLRIRRDIDIAIWKGRDESPPFAIADANVTVKKRGVRNLGQFAIDWIATERRGSKPYRMLTVPFEVDYYLVDEERAG